MTTSQTPDRLLTDPSKQVTGLMDDPDAVAAALDDLVTAGFPLEQISVLCGELGAQRVDPSSRHHGLRGRLIRFAQQVGEEREIWAQYAEQILSGRFAVVVPVRDHGEARIAAGLTRGHGGHDLVHFGAAHWERLGSEPAVPKTSP
jgi:hypothetical protein